MFESLILVKEQEKPQWHMATLNRHSKFLTAPVVYNSENWERLGQNLNLIEFWLLDEVDSVRK